MIVNSITGLSASVRRNQQILPVFLKKVFHGWEDVGMNNYYSSNRNCIKESVKFLNWNQEEDVLLVGKSLGGIKTWWLLNDYWSVIKNRMVNGHKVGVVLLDPHGWQMGDGFVGSFGVGDRNLPWRSEWDEWVHKGLLRIEVLYQRNVYPRGARFNNRGCNTKLPKFATHWNITDINTPTGRLAEAAVVDMADWLLS